MFNNWQCCDSCPLKSPWKRCCSKCGLCSFSGGFRSTFGLRNVAKLFDVPRWFLDRGRGSCFQNERPPTWLFAWHTKDKLDKNNTYDQTAWKRCLCGWQSLLPLLVRGNRQRIGDRCRTGNSDCLRDRGTATGSFDPVASVRSRTGRPECTACLCGAIVAVAKRESWTRAACGRRRSPCWRLRDSKTIRWRVDNRPQRLWLGRNRKNTPTRRSWVRQVVMGVT